MTRLRIASAGARVASRARGAPTPTLASWADQSGMHERGACLVF
jgi:hypothetical protein